MVTLNNYKQQTEDQIFLKESLEYMVEDRKKRVNNIKSDVGEKYKKIRKLQFDLIVVRNLFEI